MKRQIIHTDSGAQLNSGSTRKPASRKRSRRISTPEKIKQYRHFSGVQIECTPTEYAEYENSMIREN